MLVTSLNKARPSNILYSRIYVVVQQFNSFNMF